MALVVFLKGINVGGHRRLRPSTIASELKHFDCVSIGAAGTFVVHMPVARATIREEVMRRIPFAVEAMICDGREVLELVQQDPFKNCASSHALIPFVGVMARRRPGPAAHAFDIPSAGDWLVRILAHQDRFILGVHRRHMRAIAALGQLEEVFGQTVTIRSWRTILSIGTVLQESKCRAG
ncbi:MAG: DUF1697 domain-containing protein [Betaproteobacteria bacterium]|nr:DUF1697 domain-containing protein [Betaproteobacteria bacterium]